MRLSEINESLTRSQYRELRKDIQGFDFRRYADIFKRYPHTGKAYRIYLPANEVSVTRHDRLDGIEDEIELVLGNGGFEMTNFADNKAIDKHDREIKITKALARLGREDLMQAYNKYVTRKKEEYMVVISRHPYDIGGMSTGRSWDSCMNLAKKGKKVGGEFVHFVPMEIALGTMVAYLTTESDTKIETPLARVLILPFLASDGSGEVKFDVSNKEYSHKSINVSGFKETVAKWVLEVNERSNLTVGSYSLSPEHYGEVTSRDIFSDEWVDENPSEYGTKVAHEFEDHDDMSGRKPYDPRHVKKQIGDDRDDKWYMNFISGVSAVLHGSDTLDLLKILGVGVEQQVKFASKSDGLGDGFLRKIRMTHDIDSDAMMDIIDTAGDKFDKWIGKHSGMSFMGLRDVLGDNDNMEYALDVAPGLAELAMDEIKYLDPESKEDRDLLAILMGTSEYAYEDGVSAIDGYEGFDPYYEEITTQAKERLEGF